MRPRGSRRTGGCWKTASTGSGTSSSARRGTNDDGEAEPEEGLEAGRTAEGNTYEARRSRAARRADLQRAARPRVEGDDRSGARRAVVGPRQQARDREARSEEGRPLALRRAL